jgi:trehalose 6-phosphate phosphatase
LFQEACELFPTAVISGRGRDDVLGRITGCEAKYVIGNHGLEPTAASAWTQSSLDEARASFERVAAQVPGVDVEDKRYSLAIHYRRSRSKRAALRAIHRVIGRLASPLRVIPGKYVVNLVPPGTPHKGDALVALRTLEKADTSLYVGDDATDEDVFRLDQPGRLLTVRVGRSVTSAASYFLKGQRDIDPLLRALIQHRKDALR